MDKTRKRITDIPIEELRKEMAEYAIKPTGKERRSILPPDSSLSRMDGIARAVRLYRDIERDFNY